MPAPPVDRVLWQEQAPQPDRPAAPLPTEVDVVVVGGGYAGMAAAEAVASDGRSVLVLEKDALGTGAHTRNGGMVIPELKAGPATLEASHGPLGLRMYRHVQDAFDHVEELAGPGGIACEYQRTGQLYLAHTPRVLPHLRKLAAEHHDDFGEDVVFLEAAELADEIGSDAFAGAVRYARTGGLHPARFHAGLVARAEAAGALLASHTIARSIDRAPQGSGHRHVVRTDRGAVACQWVLVLTNATADSLLPSLARQVLPIGSFIVTTEPRPPDLLDEIPPRRRMFVDTKNLLFYWRATPDGRIAFGGRRSLGHATVVDAADYLASSLRRIHPQLADAQITHRWGGQVAITLDRLPHVGSTDEHVWYATGCNGSGVALNTWLGRQLGLMAVGEAGPPAFAELRPRRIPVKRLQRAYLPLVGRYFAWQDRP